METTTIDAITPTATTTYSPPLTEQPEAPVLFTAECKQGDEYVTISAQPMILGSRDILELWNRLSKFQVLFASPEESNFPNFLSMLQDEHSILINFDGKGMALVSDIIPTVQASVQISFWDSRLKGREPLIRELVRWIFDTLRVRRVAMPIRADARAMRAFMERVGLYFEGALKNWVKSQNKTYDLHLYGVVREEVDPHWLAGRSWAKPRVRFLRTHETR